MLALAILLAFVQENVKKKIRKSLTCFIRNGLASNHL